jgi:Phosphotransferase enzyme family
MFAYMIEKVLSAYGLNDKKYSIAVFGNGLINHTWKIKQDNKEFLLQKINQQVFKNPGDVMDNCLMLADYFQEGPADYLFVAPLLTFIGQNYFLDENDYYRLFPFIENSYSKDIASDPALAFEASKQFGKFTRLLSGFDATRLHISIPDFHNLSLRFQQFETALQRGNKSRIARSADNIQFLTSQQSIVEDFENIRKNPSFKQRVIHHDAKINNVLFDKRTQKGLCVIDLDTVMAGYFISDVGDMIRTYICPVSEEEKDESLIEIREEYFREIAKGYLSEMRAGLSDTEKNHFVYAGKFAIYMQALRFLTDYLNDDVYYSTHYPEQNLIRANNQIVLLRKYLEKEILLTEILKTA